MFHTFSEPIGTATMTILVLPAVRPPLGLADAMSTAHDVEAVDCAVLFELTYAIVPCVPNGADVSGYGPLMLPVPLKPPVPGLWVLTLPLLISTALNVAAWVAQPAGIQLVPTYIQLPSPLSDGAASVWPRSQHEVAGVVQLALLPLKSVPFCTLNFHRLGWRRPLAALLVTQRAYLPA